MPKRIFLLLIIFIALLIGYPSSNYQGLVSQGDHGRDLYAAAAVYRGELPFKDFWWVYGPLMPYYYGAFDLILGVKMTSILFGKLLLETAGGALFYLAATVLMSPWWAFIAALFFLQVQSDFFFTYNHVGGIVMIIGCLWMTLEFLKTSRLIFAWRALGFIAVLGLIKINFACAALAGLGVAVVLNTLTMPDFRQHFWQKSNRIFYAVSVFGLPLTWLGIYLFFLRGLTIGEIRQCLPYLGGDQPYSYPPSFTIPYYFTQHWLTLTHQWGSTQQLFAVLNQQHNVLFNPGFIFTFCFALLTLLLHPIWHVSTLGTFILNSTSRIPKEQRRFFWVTLIYLLCFFILNFHEFVVSGVWYRSFWTQPILLIFHFFTIATLMRLSPKFVRIIIASIFITLLSLSIVSQYQILNQHKKPEQLLKTPRGGIYVGNQPVWVDTVNTVSNFLNVTLKPNEQFFALPYDDIYYYLTGKKSPTRQLIFFDHIKIPKEQEISIIRELEEHHIAYVLVSNRIASNETGLGIWGKTYCPLIYTYVTENFSPIYKYGGNWQAEPGWADNHGVVILKRK